MKIDVRLAWQNDKQNSNQVCSFSGLVPPARGAVNEYTPQLAKNGS